MPYYKARIAVTFYGEARVLADDEGEAEKRFRDYDDWLSFLQSAEPDEGDIEIDCIEEVSGKGGE